MSQSVKSPTPTDATLAQALGWGSLALGVPMVTMPGRFDRAIGIRPDARSRTWTLVVGLREFAHAAGILAIEWPRPNVSLWTRVGGDVMDMALLISGWGKRFSTARLLGAMAAASLIGAADITAAARMSRRPDRTTAEDEPLHVKSSITVWRPREEVYGFWHNFENLPRFMAHLDSVQRTQDGRLHWKATAPAGMKVEWDAEIVEDRPNELISWRAADGGLLEHAGSIRFTPEPHGGGTEVHVNMDYAVPGGVITDTIAKLFGEAPEQQVRDDLLRFKQVIETGEVVRSEGTPEGPLTRRLIRQRPAQPLPANV